MNENPTLLDEAVGYIQLGLVKNLGWLDMAFGRAERLVKMIENKKYFTPNIYLGNENEYIPVSPDSKHGNFCFFYTEDPQDLDWIPNIRGDIKSPVSIIFWFDMKRVFNNSSIRNKELLKEEILKVLNGGFWMQNGRLKINRIFEQAENIYRGFTLDEVDNQFLMHPFAGFRFEGEIIINENC